MSTRKRSAFNVAYGLGNPLQSLAPQPIVSQRDPSSEDGAEVGTVWVNELSSDYFVLTSNSGGSANWVSSGQLTNGIVISEPVTMTVGTGDPSNVVVAAKGSIFINLAGDDVDNRMYINTDGDDGWTNFTTGA